jgi:ferric-dicitrate binding protein FerR (iron transport regulator)
MAIMTRSQQDLTRISEEAATWLLRLQEEDSPQTRAEFDKWIRQGPGHLQEFLLAQMMFAELDRLDSTFDPGSFNATDGSVVEFPRAAEGRGDELLEREEETPKQRRKWVWVSALAASLILAVGLMMAPWPLGSQIYSTKIGSQEAIKLDDGSVIYLNTSSKAQVHFSKNLREVRLLEGEALFTVAHDAGRPFIVVTDTARVRAIGTQFNVYRTGTDATRVSVIDGVVQVTAVSPGLAGPLASSPSVGEAAGEGPSGRSLPQATRGGGEPRLGGGEPAQTRQSAQAGESAQTREPAQTRESAQAGESAHTGEPAPTGGKPALTGGEGALAPSTISTAEAGSAEGSIRLSAGDEVAVIGTKIVKTAAPDVERAVAWRARRLVFPGNPISEIADELNRYSVRQIRVEGEEIRSRKMTSVFDADDPSTMIRFLSRDPNVEVIHSDTEILIRPRRTTQE